MPAERRRGALAILSMIGKAKKDVIADNKDNLLKYGLGEFATVRNHCRKLIELL
jgi:condensin complex subunit 1